MERASIVIKNLPASRWRASTDMRKTISSALFVVAACLLTGCGQPETKLTKQEEKNFKGSSEMSEEAKKRMAEGMKRMAEVQKNNGKMTPAGTTGS